MTEKKHRPAPDFRKPGPGRLDPGRLDPERPDPGRPDPGMPDRGNTDAGRPDRGRPVRRNEKAVAWFRLFLWWGSEAVRTVLRRTAPPQEHSILVASDPYAQAAWVFTGGKTYALVAQEGKRRIVIHHLPEISRN